MGKQIKWGCIQPLTGGMYIHIMGMPNDLELQGDINKEYAKIGQNVLVRTAQFIKNRPVKIQSLQLCV